MNSFSVKETDKEEREKGMNKEECGGGFREHGGGEKKGEIRKRKQRKTRDNERKKEAKRKTRVFCAEALGVVIVVFLSFNVQIMSPWCFQHSKTLSTTVGV